MSGELIYNEDVEIGRTRKICARGVTPNYIGHKVRAGDEAGFLEYFEHFDKTTVLGIGGFVPGSTWTREVDVAHLDEISVEY